MRRIALPLIAVASLGLAACGGSTDDAADTTAAATTAGAGNACTEGRTLEAGTLTIATGNPAYSPWVENDKPEAKEGFEAAVAYAVAGALGFGDANIKWVRTDFDAAIQPGKKDFDLNLQQFTITDERKQAVDMSEPYYATNQAVVGLAGSAAEGAMTIADLKSVKFGAQAATTSLDFIKNVIKPDAEPFVYDDNAAAKAALEAKQIDAIVVDLPTAFYIAAVEIEGAKVIGQFPADANVKADEFGFVLDKDNGLTSCVNAALATLKSDGSLEEITKTWLADKTSAPVIAAS